MESNRVAKLTTYLCVVACTVALIAIVLVFATSGARIGYPFENEWLEGGTLLHVKQILDGHGLYVEPTYSFVAYPYGPVYFYISAALSAIFGLGFVPLRLVSYLASAGTVFLIGLLVRKRTGRLDAAIIAAGLYAATYRLSGEWFEIAKIDSLFLFFFVAAAYLLGTTSSSRSQIAAGVLLALSCLTKQTLAVLAAPLMFWVLIDDWRRGLRVGGVAAAVFIGLSSLSMIASDGWFWYYVVTLPSRHGLFDRPDLWFYFRFWWDDVLRPLPIASFLALVYSITMLAKRESRRTDLFAFSLLAGALLVSWIGRLNVGYANVLMPAYAGLAIFLGQGIGRLMNETSAHRSRLRPIGVAAVLLLVTIQLVLLRFDPRECLPTRADRLAGHELVARIAEMPGEVVVSAHPYLLHLAGKPVHAHQAAFMTFIGGFGGEPDALALAELARLEQAVAAQRFSAIILDGPKKPNADSWFVPLEGHYSLDSRIYDDPKVFQSVTGAPRQPRYLYLPNSDPR